MTLANVGSPDQIPPIPDRSRVDRRAVVGRRRHHGRLAVLVVLVMGLVAGPVTAASARARPRIEVGKKCYLQNTAIPVSGSHFVPRKKVEVRLAHRERSTIAHRNGRFRTTIRAPHLKGSLPRVRSYRLRVDEHGHAARRERRSIRIRVTTLGVSLSPNHGIRKGQKIRHRFSGFMHGHAIYAHYALNSTVVGNARLGRLHGPCGTLSTRAEMIPHRLWRTGSWLVQYDTHPVYSRSTHTYLRLSITIG